MQRVFDGYSSFSSPSPTSVRVVIVRDSGMLGAAIAAKLSIDGIDIASIRSSERLELYMQPKSYIIGIESSPKQGSALVESKVSIEPDKVNYFRISTAGIMDGHFTFQPTARINE